MQIVVLELSKIPQEPDASTLYDWLRFLRAQREEEFMEVAARNPQIKKATVILQKLSEDERTRLIAEAYHKREWDLYGVREMGRAEGLEMGIEKGLAKGLEQGEVETAKNLKQMGLSLEQIQAATELSEKMINAL
jgi:predicted transposase/invertase (TIGR01784 family)